MSHYDGLRAAEAGEPVSSCPFAPSDPEGRSWRQGWLDGESIKRRKAGTFDHTPEEYSDYKRSIGWSAEALADPVVDILGGYDPLPEREEPLEDVYRFSVSMPAQMLQDMYDRITQQVLYGVNAFSNLQGVLATSTDQIRGLHAASTALDEPVTFKPSQVARAFHVPAGLIGDPLQVAAEVEPYVPLADWLKVGTSAVIPSLQTSITNITSC